MFKRDMRDVMEEEFPDLKGLGDKLADAAKGAKETWLFHVYFQRISCLTNLMSDLLEVLMGWGWTLSSMCFVGLA